MWRIAKPNQKGEFEGGHLAWKDLVNSDWNLSSTQFHAEARTPYIVDIERKRFLGFENIQSITEKVQHPAFCSPSLVFRLFMRLSRTLVEL